MKQKKNPKVKLYFQEIAPEVDQLIDDLAESAAAQLGPVGKRFLKHMPGLRDGIANAVTTATFIKREAPDRPILIGIVWAALTDFMDGTFTKEDVEETIREIQAELDPNETTWFVIDNMANAILRKPDLKGFTESYAFIAVLDGTASEVYDACSQAIERFSLTWDDFKEES